MIVKVHKTADGRVVVAICDSKLVGKKFDEGKLQLDLSSNFYRGDERSEDEIGQLVKDPCIVNLVGEESIGWAVKVGLVEKKDIIKISNVPHVQAIVGEEE